MTSAKPSCRVQSSCTVLVLQKNKKILALKRRDRVYKIDSSRTVWAILIRLMRELEIKNSVDLKSYAGKILWVIRPMPWIGIRAEKTNKEINQERSVLSLQRSLLRNSKLFTKGST